MLRPSKYLKSDTWQQFSIEIMAPPSASYFYLEVRTYQNSIAYWDNFVFEENLATYDTKEKLSDILIYPNPSHNYLIINNIINLQHIDIQNLKGTRIWSSDFAGEQTVTIPVSGLPEGLYIIRIHMNDKHIIRKFIKIAD
jgi:hypothetical protein